MTMSEEIGRILDIHQQEEEGDLAVDEIIVDFDAESVLHVVSTVPPPPEERPENPTEEELERQWDEKTQPARYRTILSGRPLVFDNSTHDAETARPFAAALPIEPDND